MSKHTAHGRLAPRRHLAGPETLLQIAMFSGRQRIACPQGERGHASPNGGVWGQRLDRIDRTRTAPPQAGLPFRRPGMSTSDLGRRS